MTREKRKPEDMIEGFNELSSNISSLKFILEKPNNELELMKILETDLMDWVDSVNSNINKLNSLKEDVIRFYTDN